jgi:exodeoxyribonuclease-3
MAKKMDSALHLITYNLHFHLAYEEISQLQQQHNPDIVCIQECVVQSLDKRIGDLRLAAHTTIGEQGLAIYLRDKRFKVLRQFADILPLSFYERVRPEDRERLLVAEVEDKKTGKRLFVACFHATHLVASNHHRRKQIAYSIKALDQLRGDTPIILAGDYNYPLFHKRLTKFVKHRDYQLAISAEHTFKSMVSFGKFDLAAVSNVHSVSAEALPQNGSDHRPVLVVVEP